MKLLEILIITVLIAHTSGDNRDLGEIPCTTVIYRTECRMNEVCKARCRYSCLKTEQQLEMWGTEIYTYDTPICKAAVHDLRISTWNSSARDVLVQRIPYTGIYRGAIRFGFATKEYGRINYVHHGSIIFTSPRISEDILDVVSLHKNFLFLNDETHIQECVQTASEPTRKIAFDTYMEREKLPNNLLKSPVPITIGDSEIYRMVWQGNLPLQNNSGFQCLPDKSMLSIVTSLAFRRDAHFYPVKLSLTANVNETVTLAMKEREAIARMPFFWKKDGLPVNKFIRKTTFRTQLILHKIQVGSAGIYSLEYRSGTEAVRRRGVMRLIVRVCPRGHYGDDCRQECPHCRNGGICHDITGVCICPPGFNGTFCETACSPGYFGKRCEESCVPPGAVPSAEDQCKGILMCLPDPYGCSCAAGYTGVDCNEVCGANQYGAGCSERRECHCAQNESCNRFSGLCEDGCMAGWHGFYCTESYPVLTHPPSLLSVTKESAKISFNKWSDSDIGSGSVISYIVVYKRLGSNLWRYRPHILADESLEYIAEIENLKPGTDYSVAVVVVDESGSTQEHQISVTHFNTKCDRPLMPPTDIHIDAMERIVNISWKLPHPDSWNCWILDVILIYNSSEEHQVKRSQKHQVKRSQKHSFWFPSMPFTDWSLTLCSSAPGNETDWTCSDVQNFTTKEAAPNSITNLGQVSTASRDTTIIWNEPSQKNGILRYYAIRYQQVGWRHACNIEFNNVTKIQNTTELSFHIKDLRASALYSVWVSAVTVAEGQTQLIRVETEKDAPDGLPLNVRLISRRNGLNWGEPACNLTNGGITNYAITVKGMEQWDSGEQNWTTPELHFIFAGLVPYTKYVVGLAAGNEVGFSSNFAQLFFTTYSDVPPGPTHATIYSKSSNALLLSWLPPYPPYGQLHKYTISYRDETEKSKFIMIELNVSDAQCLDEIRKLDHCYTLAGLKISHVYRIEIRAFNQNIFDGSQPMIVSGETSESTPEAPTEGNVTDRTESSLTLFWNEPYTTNGNLTSYRLTMTVQDSFNLTYIGYNFSTVITNANIQNYTFEHLSPATTFIITIEASTKAGFGEPLHLVANTSNTVPTIDNEPLFLDQEGHEVLIHLFPVSIQGGPITAYFIVVDPVSSHSRRRRSHKNIFFTVNCSDTTHPEKKPYVAGSIEYIPVNGTNFAVGDGSCNDGYYNAPLRVGNMYRVGVAVLSRYGNEEKYSEIKYISEPILVSYAVLHHVSTSFALALGFLIPMLIILGIGALFVYFRRPVLFQVSQMKMKILTSKTCEQFAACNEALDEMEMIETESLCEELSNRIAVKDLENYVWSSMQDNKIKKEYMCLPKGQKYSCSIAKLPENKAKNRYGNLLPYDHSRVVLDIMGDDPHSDFINANYIDGYKRPKKYIATQGPKPLTVNDFWRMVWKTGACKILMVTNLVESGKTKCEKYWTENSDTYGEFSVQLESLEPYADYVIRTFKISKGHDQRELKHLHFLTWPDHGVPMYTTPVFSFLKKARSYKPDHDAPIIVHCSAGIGRTGTVILLDSMFEMGTTEGYVDVIDQLCTMRRQRSNIVENYDQYIFVHNALLDTLCREETCILCSNFFSHLKKLHMLDEEIGITLMENQFKALNKQSKQLHQKDMRAAYLPENQDKNRNTDILPPERSRPILRTSPNHVGNGYINAVYVDGYRQKDSFIVTQYPLPNTVVDFWRMIHETKSRTIVLLQNIDFSDTKCPKIWPLDGKEVFGEFQVECQTVVEEHSVSISTFFLSLLDSAVSEQPITVKVFQLLCWSPEDNLPESPELFLSLMERVERWLLQSPQHVITVQCLDGASACGIFCAAMFLCDKIKSEHETDVFQAVKGIRVNRPKFVKNLAQYEFLHDIVMAYLDSFETYANFQ